MSLTLTTPLSLPNGTRLLISHVDVDDDNSVMNVTFQMRSPVATDLLVSQRVIQVRNGLSDRLSRGGMPPGSSYDTGLVVTPGVQSTPTGYTDAINAWRGGATANARKTALETLGLSAGWIDSTLAGT